MKDEQIESILRERFEPIRATRTTRRTSSLPRLATVTVVLAALTTAVVVYTGLGPTPAQAMQRANEALKGVRSFRVEQIHQLSGATDRSKVVIVRTGDMVITRIDRDPYSLLAIQQGKRGTYLPKGSKVAYTRIAGEEDTEAPQPGEEPLSYVFRTCWRAGDPFEPTAGVSKEITERGGVLEMRFQKDMGTFIGGSGAEGRSIRKGLLRIDKRTSRPIELQIEDVDRYRVTPYTTSFRFEYDSDSYLPTERLLPPGTKIVDLDKWAERQAKAWNAKPIAKGGRFTVVDRFTSKGGWTMLIVGGAFSTEDTAVDDRGNTWLVRTFGSGSLTKHGFTNWLLVPLEPRDVNASAQVTFTVDRKPFKLTIPAASSKPYPEWIPLVDNMNKLSRYSFITESTRAWHYRQVRDEKNELRWLKASIPKFKQAHPNIDPPALERIKQLEATTR